jgi:multidrug resistance protein MdtO
MTRFGWLRRTIRAELAPYPGRATGSLLDTLSMVLALVTAETLRVPGMGLALALILLIQRETPGIAFRNIVQIVGGAVFACIVCLGWVQVTDGTEVLRFLGFILGVFAAGFLMATTHYPLFFTIFGFYGFVDLSGWDSHRATSAIVTTMLFNIASLSIALGMAGVIHFLFGTRLPAETLREELHKRLRSLAAFHRELAERTPKAGMSELHHRIVQYAHAGDRQLNELYEEARKGDATAHPPGVRFRIGLIVRALERSARCGFSALADCASHERIAELCDHILDPLLPKPPALEGHASALLSDIFNELSRYNEVTESDAPCVYAAVPTVDSGWSFFHSDAFVSPAGAIYSLKLTLCAAICYLIYNAVAWPGILTAVVTVLFTGLASTGAMKQKQLYRLSGAAVGGVLAIAAESVLFPNMDSITSFVVLVGLICLISAWISRSPRIGYVGVQIAFAFFLTNLVGFGAAGQIAPARDRVIGIALGVLVMWFVFDQIWPTRPSDLLECIRNRVQHNAEQVNAFHSAARVGAMREEVAVDLAQMQVLMQSASFDFGRNQRRELVRARRLTRETEAAAGRFYSKIG